MASDYRYNPFLNSLEPIAITGEIHVIPTNSPFTIRLHEVPLKEAPSTVSMTIGGIAGVEVAAEPAPGEFRCDYTTGADNDENWNTGLIQFNAADAGKTVVASYNGIGSLASADFHGSQLFDVAGTYTFTVPKGVKTVYVTGCGGGGGGAGAMGGYWGGGGGAGACAMKTPLAVVAGQSYVITVGAGGAGGFITGSAGSYVHNAGGAGGTSSFGSLLSLSGGGGANSSISGGTIGSAGGVGAMGGTPNREVATYSESVALVDIGSGGGNIFSAGGAIGNNTLRFTGANGSLYGGGGSPALDYKGTTKRNGGAGASGFILVEW